MDISIRHRTHITHREETRLGIARLMVTPGNTLRVSRADGPPFFVDRVGFPFSPRLNRDNKTTNSTSRGFGMLVLLRCEDQQSDENRKRTEKISPNMFSENSMVPQMLGC